jgi:hypothetical protein
MRQTLFGANLSCDNMASTRQPNFLAIRLPSPAWTSPSATLHASNFLPKLHQGISRIPVHSQDNPHWLCTAPQAPNVTSKSLQKIILSFHIPGSYGPFHQQISPVLIHNPTSYLTPLLTSFHPVWYSTLQFC